MAWLDAGALTLLGFGVTVALTTAAWVVTHRQKLTYDARAERLRLLDRRINEFYGPLSVTAKVNKRMLDALLAQRRVQGTPFLNADAPRSPADVSTWRLWVETNFMPANQRLVDLVEKNAHLIREDKVPQCLLDLAAHVAGYRIVLERWKREDFSESFSPFPYPNDLLAYAEASYAALKDEQLRLIGLQRPTRGGGGGKAPPVVEPAAPAAASVRDRQDGF